MPVAKINAIRRQHWLSLGVDLDSEQFRQRRCRQAGQLERQRPVVWALGVGFCDYRSILRAVYVVQPTDKG